VLPALDAAHVAAVDAAGVAELRQLAMAMLAYESASERFPPGRVGCDGMAGRGDAAGPNDNPCPANTAAFPSGPARGGASGFVLTLPHVEQLALADAFGTALPHGGIWETNTSQWRTPQVVAALPVRPPVMTCPNDDSRPTVTTGSLTVATGSYAMCAGSNGPYPGTAGMSPTVKTNNTGMFNYLRARSAAHVRDGLANTFMLGESTRNDDGFFGQNLWTQGGRYHTLKTTGCPPNSTPGRCATAFDYYANTAINGDFSSKHGGGVSMAFADGHTMFVSDLIAMGVYQALSTVAGGETIDVSEF
jgi:prepilin-type processing-associated H-X9-DG protein